MLYYIAGCVLVRNKTQPKDLRVSGKILRLLRLRKLPGRVLISPKFDALKLLVKRFGKISPSEDFGYFWWLLWLRNPIFPHDFEIGHLVGG